MTIFHIWSDTEFCDVNLLNLWRWIRSGLKTLPFVAFSCCIRISFNNKFPQSPLQRLYYEAVRHGYKQRLDWCAEANDREVLVLVSFCFPSSHHHFHLFFTCCLTRPAPSSFLKKKFFCFFYVFLSFWKHFFFYVLFVSSNCFG